MNFLVGTEDAKVGRKGIIVPYPAEGNSSRLGPPKLKKVKVRDTTLTLPEGVKASELKWLSVWCNIFKVSFGHVIF